MRAVGVSAMLDRDDRHLVTDAVDDPEVSALGAVQTFELEPERLAHA